MKPDLTWNNEWKTLTTSVKQIKPFVGTQTYWKWNAWVSLCEGQILRLTSSIEFATKEECEADLEAHVKDHT